MSNGARVGCYLRGSMGPATLPAIRPLSFWGAVIAMAWVLSPLGSFAQDSYRAFGAAVSHGELDIVQRMVKDRPELVNARMSPPWVQTPLHLAVTNRQSRSAGLLLELGANANAQDWLGNTPLHLAAGLDARAKEFLTLLLDHGAKLQARNNERFSPLDVAIDRGTMEAVDFLLEKQADVNASGGPMEMSPLHLAALKGRRDAAESLLSHGADVRARDGLNGQLPLHWAALGGDGRIRQEALPGTTPDYLGTAGLLLARGADVNATNRLGGTALHLAVMSGDPAMATLLLEHRATVDSQNDRGETPLFAAARLAAGLGGLPAGKSSTNAAHSLVGLLLANHANVNTTNFQGRNVLQELVFNGIPADSALVARLGRSGATGTLRRKDRVVLAARRADLPALEQLLSEHPEMVDTADDVDGEPLIQHAVSQNQTAVAEILLRHHAKVASRDSNGRSLLHLADSREIVELLLRYQADLNARLPDGSTPLHRAAMTRGASLEALLANGANPNLPDDLGQTPLHRAAKFSSVSSVEALLAKGADVDLRDKNNQSPLDLAMEDHRDDVVACLKKHGVTGPAEPRLTSGILGAAAQGNLPELEAYLREHPEAVNARMEGGVSLLLQAVTSGRVEVVKLLLKSKADPRLLADEEHRMFMTTNHAMLRLLVAAKADINAGNADGETPLHKAIELGMLAGPPLVEALLQNGADPNRKDAAGQTPLGKARTFEKSFARMAAKTPDSPVSAAPLQHLRDIITVLRNHGARD